jgi:T4 RnlA family RNA ligase
MNDYQTTLYHHLMELVATNEAFSKKDQETLDGTIYRVFSYRLAGWSDFLLPGALECRGIMFELVDDKPVRLASMPMQKFFNDGEGSVKHDYNTIVQIMLKADGSLISTYLHKGELRLKSKTALMSDHAVNAMRWLDLPAQASFKEQLFVMTGFGYTVNMEYTSPEPYMRIVVAYQEPKLTVLNIRNNADGTYLDRTELDYTSFGAIQNHWIDDFCIPEDGQVFVDHIHEEVGIEGYVIQLQDGTLVKVKTDWYRALHFSKDSVTNPRRLYEAVLEETTDDLREMFSDDSYSLNLIEEMEQKVFKIYNHLVKTVEEYYEANKHLDRAAFAILGQKVLDKKAFSIAMMKYTGKVVDYKGLLKKWYKDFGFKDEKVVEEE